MTDEASADQGPTAHTLAARERILATLPFDDDADFEDADRGFLATLEPAVLRRPDGHTVWDGQAYDFLRDDCPDTVNPSLWRQAQLAARHGLYEVAPGIYQIRGFDLSNMTLLEGDSGVVVIDPLTTAESAAAGLALYRAHRGDKPVTGVIYTHSHVDHFGGALGVLTPEDVAAGRCPVIAPEGMAEHAVAENIFAGAAMSRRAGYMFGGLLPRTPRGTVTSAIGQNIPAGSIGLVPPTLEIRETGQQQIIDGVRLVFQLTPGTEAPAEMNIHLPDHRALCMAENAIHTMHNILTPRGALVRDAHIWAHYLTESINLFARKSDVVFSSHLWPTWGTDRVVNFMSLQRDMYGYMHDQTLRLLNQGFVGSEIAEMIQMPPAVENAWHTRGYYGSVSHNVKAIYQRYMGWFDGNPAHLWEHPPVESAERHVDFMGGADEVLRKARAAYDSGDYRWVAQVVNYVIFADPSNEAAKRLQASAFEQLGYGAENAVWRNFFLSGAQELRHGVGVPQNDRPPASMLAGLTVEQLFDGLALRIDGPKAWDLKLVTDWHISDENRTHRGEMSNGLLVHYDRLDGDGLPEPVATFTLTRLTLIRTLLGAQDFPTGVANGDITFTGDPTRLAELLSVLDAPDPAFSIVTP
ncbi:alkyl/aryl-sulfatase [Nocardia alni]|uniref:alkyl/aryl-sulfatase n=1 Tax=Nocardia alni TaxID=2815723 RepID=UPI001C248959|nr:alkyl sulfatase dimerization domain-containing protein [Nocardia alni]